MSHVSMRDTNALPVQADLLPKGAPKEGVRAWLDAIAQHKRLSPTGTFLVSSRTGPGCCSSSQLHCFVMRAPAPSRPVDLYVLTTVGFHSR